MGDETRQILFVEDTTDTRDLVEFSMQQEGFKVVPAQTADEGLDLARTGNFALILLDIGLPDKDGLNYAATYGASTSRRRFFSTRPLRTCSTIRKPQRRVRRAVCVNPKTRPVWASLPEN